MTDVKVLYVDVYVLRPAANGGFEVLALKRAEGQKRAGTWETIHSHVDKGEKPAETALRELREETGLEPLRLYNVSRVESFYEGSEDTIVLIPVFCAFVAAGAPVTLSEEHAASSWLGPDAAKRRFTWPREVRALDDVLQLFGSGDAGPLEDVLRVL